MPGFENSVLTDVGLTALTDAEAGAHIEYTHMEAGDGDIYGGETEIYGMTALNHYVMDFPITNFSNDGDGQITLVGVISSKNVTTGFYFKELAVRCTIDSGAPILYTVSYAGATGDYIPASTETPVVIQTVQIIIRIDRAPNVTVIVQPGLDVTCQNIGLGSVGPGWFRDKIGQVCWFKRINSPKKTLELSETSDIVSIDVPTVDVNLDMWVALGNPDIFPHFSTIQNALDYLKPLRINPGITVTIYVSGGVWTNSSMITVDHPQGSQIKILGTVGPSKTVTTASRVGDIVTLNAAVGTFSDIAVGDFILYYNSSNGPGACVSGVRLVTAVAADGSNLSYALGFYGPYPGGGISGGTVYPVKTVIHFAAGQHGMLIKNSGLGLLQNVILRGTPSTASIYGLRAIAGISNIDYVASYGWFGTGGGSGIGIYAAATGTIFLTKCSACGNHEGFYAFTGGSYITAEDSFSNCNSASGFTSNAAYLAATRSYACGNTSNGFSCGNGGYIGVNFCWGLNNNSTGLRADLHAHSAPGPTQGGTFTGNAWRDIALTILSSIVRGGGAIIYNSANIAPNVLSADGCYFSP